MDIERNIMKLNATPVNVSSRCLLPILTRFVVHNVASSEKKYDASIVSLLNPPKSC